MDIAVFNERLIATVLDKCRSIIILLVITIVLLGAELIYYNVTKSNDGFSLLNILPINHTFKNRFSTQNQITLHCIGAVILLGYLAWAFFPAYCDIQNSQYSQVAVRYTNEEQVQSRRLFSNGYVWVETEEDGFYLELPVDWNAYEFPLGTHRGIVCYSEKSKILLSFEPQSISE